MRRTRAVGAATSPNVIRQVPPPINGSSNARQYAAEETAKLLDRIPGTVIAIGDKAISRPPSTTPSVTTDVGRHSMNTTCRRESRVMTARSATSRISRTGSSPARPSDPGPPPGNATTATRRALACDRAEQHAAGVPVLGAQDVRGTSQFQHQLPPPADPKRSARLPRDVAQQTCSQRISCATSHPLYRRVLPSSAVHLGAPRNHFQCSASGGCCTSWCRRRHHGARSRLRAIRPQDAEAASTGGTHSAVRRRHRRRDLRPAGRRSRTASSIDDTQGVIALATS